MSQSRVLTGTLLLAILLLAVACSSVLPPTKPSIVLSSPPHGSTFREGEDVAFQSTANDSKGVTRVELSVDGNVVRTDTAPNPQGQATFTLIQTWKATQGSHTISVRAYNTTAAVSDPAVITVNVAAAVVQAPTPTNTVAPTAPPPTTAAIATSTTAPPGPCTNNSAFVADVTVPDGTLLAPAQTFNKIWRVRNSGTCAWDASYQFTFIGGEAMAAAVNVAVPATAPGANADLLIPMTAPASPGIHIGQWRLKAPGGAAFGTAVTVNINVIGPTAQPPPPPPPQASGCSGTPNIESFSASPSSVLSGGSSTLSWGSVTNADSVEIDQGIGGVAAPGNATVSPGSTTTYTMTAHCGSNVTTRQAKITVTFLIPIIPILPTVHPDLIITAFSVSPNPPHKGATVNVSISVYNDGTGSSGSFKVRWLAGTTFVTAPPCTWTVASLPAHGGQVLNCSPSSPYNSTYGSITTRAEADYEHSVTESNEGNNTKDMTYQVLP